MVEIKAQLRNLRMSPKKVRLVSDAIKGLDVESALVRLQFTPKIAAPVVAKLIRSAVANAENNNNMKVEMLMVKNVLVDQGIPLKRWRPAAFGSAHQFKKHGSHVVVVLSLKAGAAVPEDRKAKKAAQKQETAAVNVSKKKAAPAVNEEKPRVHNDKKKVHSAKKISKST